MLSLGRQHILVQRMTKIAFVLQPVLAAVGSCYRILIDLICLHWYKTKQDCSQTGRQKHAAVILLRPYLHAVEQLNRFKVLTLMMLDQLRNR